MMLIHSVLGARSISFQQESKTKNLGQSKKTYIRNLQSISFLSMSYLCINKPALDMKIASLSASVLEKNLRLNNIQCLRRAFDFVPSTVEQN
jgi:hypothetical protein